MKYHFEFINRTRYSLFLLIVLLIGLNINLPTLTNSNHEGVSTNNHLLTAITGGTTSKPTLFSLGIGSFMIAGMIFAVFEMSQPAFITTMSEKKKGVLKNVVTFIIALFQGYTRVGHYMEKVDSRPNILLFLSMIFILATGALFVSWMANLNLQKGLGGTTLLILPGMFMTFPTMFTGKSHIFLNNLYYLGGLAVITIIVIIITLFLYETEYHIKVKRIGLEEKFNNSYLSFRLLNAGSFPLMISISILSLPSVLFSNDKKIEHFFSVTSLSGVIIYGIILYVVSVVFSVIFVRPQIIAKNLKESGDYIINVVPGEDTQKYIHKKVLILGIIGSTYLTILVIVPLIISILIENVFFSSLSVYLGYVFTLTLIFDRLIEDGRFIYYKKSYDLFGKKVDL